MNDLLGNEQLWWYVARSGGIVALVLTGLAVIWGLALSTKVMAGAPAPKWLLALHRWLGGLSVTFTGIHIAALVADSYVHFGLIDLLVPFASDWKPGAVAWGIVSMYLLLAVQISSMMMKRIPRKWWKLIHMSSWLLFWSGLVHGITAGTDAANPLYVAVTGTMTLLVTFLTGYRIFTSRRSSRARTSASAARSTTSAAVSSEPASAIGVHAGDKG
ncbi:MAG: ferric reductase-like transmembrane domain-containing protein [Acidimicrobiales bacterium]